MSLSELNKLAKNEELNLNIPEEREVVGSGVLTLDLATRRAGLPRGQIIDFYGDEMLGKTTFALQMVGERIRHGEQCVYIDVEHRLTKQLIDILIPDRKLFQKFDPPHGDAALRLLEKCVNIPEVRMIVMDSLAAVIPEAEMDADEGGKGIALAAREITKSIKRLMGPVVKNMTICVIINQVRNNPMPSYGQSPRTITGGKIMKYMASMRMGMYRDSLIKEGDIVIGQRVRIDLEKNSFDHPFGKAYATIMYGKGIDRNRDLVDAAIMLKVLEKSGSWLIYHTEDDKEIKVHGESEFLEKYEQELPRIAEQVRAKMVAQRDQHAAALVN